MDPVLDGFVGVLVELVFDGECYVLAESALGTGNRLIRFRSYDREVPHALFEAELSDAGGADRVARGRTPTRPG